jgi:hypothetical protein
MNFWNDGTKGSKHGKLVQNVRMLKIPFKNMIVFYKHKKVDWIILILHFENIYASIGFMVSWV